MGNCFSLSILFQRFVRNYHRLSGRRQTMGNAGVGGWLISFAIMEEWEQRFLKFFDHPQQVCIGAESAAQAAQRFDAAVKDALRQVQGETIAIIAHGTVTTLFTAQYNLVSPFELWQTLTLPSFIYMNSESFKCQDVFNDDG